jgi:N,N-dimethylformamidase beta subunit-like, C-terminal
VLIVLPTNTWQAYNFQDVDGNGYGDTWYAGPPNGSVKLSRTYIARGVPPRFYRYDLPFLHWFYWSGKSAEFISDSDFDLIASGDDLARAYDLVLFEGHEEYVTSHEYDVVTRFRDLGGNLMFLSANNFFWKVDKQAQTLRKIGKWRDVGRPEAALIGVQYRANDDGQRQGLFTVTNAAAATWLWDGTGLTDGSTFGQFVGGYGIEIDATTPESPPGTLVVAQIPDLFGPGITAQMSYYETVGGAKVFAAGSLDFGGSATFWPIRRVLDNLWARLSAP